MLFRVSQTDFWREFHGDRFNKLIDAGAWILYGQNEWTFELLVNADSGAEALEMARNLDEGFETVHLVTGILGQE